MIVLLYGPPGCGKGTQSPVITRLLGIPAISTGEMLRDEIARSTPLGVAIESKLAAGSLASDEAVNDLLLYRVQKPDCREGFLLDGYPRTVPQAVFLTELLQQLGFPSPLVFHLETPAETLIQRISARRQCPSCLRIYNLLHRPPVQQGLCDHDGISLICRRDDDAAVVTERLRAYEMQTAPVLSYYDGDGCFALDGNRPSHEVSAELEHILESRLVRVNRVPVRS